MKNTFSALLLAAAVQQASATFRNAPKFECPSTSTDTCVEQQAVGFDWASLGLGSFSAYGGFQFSGFSCASSFGKGSKRDLAARTSGFQQKCITGKASKNTNNAPKVSCGSQVSKFSIEVLQVSVEFDCDLEFHYGMPDGSTCKHKKSCSTGGTTVENTQCGGATDVIVVLPSPPSGKDSCDVGIHSVGFHCGSTTSIPGTVTATTVPGTSVTSPPVVTSPVVESSSTSPVGSTTAPETVPSVTPSTSPIESAPPTTAPVESTPPTTSPAVESPSSVPPTFGNSTTTPPAAESSIPPASVPGTVETTSNSPVTSTEVPPPASTGPAPSEVITTVVVETTTTLCPVTLTQTSAGSTSLVVTSSISTVTVSRTSTVCTACEGKPTTSPVATGESPSPSTPATSCPDVLPSCMNTWLSVSGCSSNTDATCYCPDSKFTNLVFECLSARGADDSVIVAAQAYFQGICASYVPQNPAIITGAVPSPVTITNAPSATPYGPVTVITIDTTLTVPCTDTAGSTIPGSSTYTVVTSAVTVPQVVFTTVPGASTTAEQLVPGTAVPVVQASTTAAAISSFTTAFAGTGSVTASSTRAAFTGAASKHNNAVAGVLGAALAVAAFAV